MRRSLAAFLVLVVVSLFERVGRTQASGFDFETTSCQILGSAPGTSPKLVLQDSDGFDGSCMVAGGKTECVVGLRGRRQATSGKKMVRYSFAASPTKAGNVWVLTSDSAHTVVLIDFGVGRFSWATLTIDTERGSLLQKHCVGDLKK